MIRPATILALGAALSVLACDDQEPAEPQLPVTPGNAPMTPERPPAPVVLPDADVQRVLAARYASDPAVDMQGLSVAVVQGIVKLSGKRTDLLTSVRAREIAHATAGVRGFVDLTAFEPVERDDAEIARDVRAALKRDPAADKYEVSVDVKFGHVELDGWVESWFEHDQAKRAAMRVPGVVAVESTISVDPAAERTDADIENDIRATLEHDARVGAEDISVDVQKGVARLSGRVGSAAERTVAERTATSIAGVRKVHADDLTVEPEAMDRFRRDPAQLAFDDETLAEAVEAAVTHDPRLLGSTVAISVRDGIARLGGVVPSADAEKAALDDAAATVGIRGVVDGLRVSTAS